jgi:hypothetical protein
MFELKNPCLTGDKHLGCYSRDEMKARDALRRSWGARERTRSLPVNIRSPGGGSGLTLSATDVISPIQTESKFS